MPNETNVMEGKWGYSRDGEWFNGPFDSREELAAEVLNGVVYMGQFRAPIPPEQYIDAELLTEHVLCQDDYCLDCAEGCIEGTKKQQEDLTEAIRVLFRDWLVKHDLMPIFGIVESSERVEVIGGILIAAADATENQGAGE